MAKGGRKRKRVVKREPIGVVYVKSTFNNTIITVTDSSGNVVAWASSGSSGFSGTRKATPFAASKAARTVAKAAMSAGIEKVEVRVKGPGAGREAVIRSIQAAGLTVYAILDTTPIPHNGCRPPKRRRV